MNVESFYKLADYLESMVKPENFSMTQFCYNQHPLVFPKKAVYDCNTVACALGYGPAAGIPAAVGERWLSYCRRQFGIEDMSEAYQWCFHDDWDEVDNTPQGAARRIRYMLEHGVPANWYRQMEGLDTLALSSEFRDKIETEISHFKKNKEWFEFRGMPYKLTYLLHGPPGTGKTSLIKSIASEFNMNICSLNINGLTDGLLEHGLANVPKNSVIIIEDFDSSSATQSRKPVESEKSKDKMPSFLSLTGILNALDGVVPLDDCIIFLTTNHIEKIDPAIYRKGRVDNTVYIGETPAGVVEEFSQRIFPDYDFSNVEFKDVRGCEIHEAIRIAKDDPEEYIECLLNDDSEGVE